MIKIVRTDASHEDFLALVVQLDAELAIRDGADHDFYDQFNKLDSIRHVVLAYEQEQAISCGAMKPFDAQRMEIKRMYTVPEARGKGLAVQVLHSLETWAKELGMQWCQLETGIRQPEAIRLYEKCGYQRIANYGQYIGVKESLCFEKGLS